MVFKYMSLISKKMIYKIHAYISLIFFIPLIIICFSGSLLVYKDEIDHILIPQKIKTYGSSQKARLDFDILLNFVSKRHENSQIVGWHINKNTNTADKVWLVKHGEKEWNYLYIDAFSGEIKTEPNPLYSGVTGVILGIHANLLLGKNGKIFVGIIGILIFIISITGFAVYKNFWKNLFRLRFAKVAVFMSDIHKFIGVFSTPILLAISLTGAWWELRFLFLPKFDNSNFIINEQIYNKNLSVESIIKRAKSDLPGFKLHYIGFPAFNGANITLYGYKDGQSFLYDEYASQITYDKNSGELLYIKDIDNANFKEKFLSSFRKAHFGYYNETTKFIWFLIGLTPLILTISGLYLWIKRTNFKRRKR